MINKTVIFLAVFGGVFYLVKSLFPLLQDNFGRWQKKRLENITPKLDRVFLDIPLNRLMLIDVLSPLISGSIGFILTHNLYIAFTAGAIGLILPVFILKHFELKRRRKFANQLVDGLLILSGSLKAGLSLLQAFETLESEMPAPISQEFNLVLRQMQMGVSLEKALTSLKERMRLDELDMMVTAMLVARETGGDLTVTFSRVIHTIHERDKLDGRVKALCIQAKLQGVIMSILPIVFGIFVYKVDSSFFNLFIKDSFGRGLLIYAFISEALGIIFIRKFSKVDI
jgi:tight adherence protein B